MPSNVLQKIIVIGDANVGKSALMNRFARNKYTDEYTSTIGVDFQSYSFEVFEKTVKVQIWDTAGQERYRTIIPSYFRGSSGVLFCFDITNKKSFESLDEWNRIYDIHSNKNSQKAIVGLKTDLNIDRQVSHEEAKEYADKNGYPYYEISSKMNTQYEIVTILFTDLCGRILKDMDAEDKSKNKDDKLKYEDYEIITMDSISLLGFEVKKTKKCC